MSLDSTQGVDVESQELESRCRLVAKVGLSHGTNMGGWLRSLQIVSRGTILFQAAGNTACLIERE